MKGKKKMLSWTKIAQKQLDADQEIHIKVHRGVFGQTNEEPSILSQHAVKVGFITCCTKQLQNSFHTYFLLLEP